MTAADLVSEIEPMSYPERARHLGRLARRATGTQELVDLVAELGGRSTWEARVALTLAGAAGDLGHLRACLDSPEPWRVERAIGPAVRHRIGAGELIDRLPGLSAVAGQALVAALRAARATDLADALLGPLRDRYGDRVAASVLVSCSTPVVDRSLPELAWAVPNWRSLVRRHPGPVLDHADREVVARSADGWPASVEAMVAGLAEAATCQPGRVLDLLQRATELDLSRSGPFGAVLGRLARHDPARVARLLLRHGGEESALSWSRPGRRVWRALSAADDDVLAELVRVLDMSVAGAVVRAVAPRRRPRVLGLGPDDPDAPDGRSPVHDLDVLDLLPWWVRPALARRLLESTRPDAGRSRRLAARLPWPEAEPLLRAAATGPDADTRALAYPMLVRAAAATRDPRTVETLVTVGLDRLDRDQEPVRAAAVQALAAVRCDLLTDVAVGALGARLARAAQERDASHRTRSTVLAWAVATVATGVRGFREACVLAGTHVLTELASHLEHPVPSSLSTLPPAAVEAVHRALRPRFDTDRGAGRHDVLLALVEALGPQAAQAPDLQERLREAAGSADRPVAARAVGLWLASARDRGRRVEVLLRWDGSTALLPSVATAVATRRTDLLELVLPRTVQGRFADGDARRVVPLSEEAWRWTAAQQERYAAELDAVVRDPTTQEWDRAAGVTELARLPGTQDLLRATLDDPARRVADAALAGLARVDRPDLVVGDLLARVEGEQAHLVGPVLRRTTRRVPPRALLGPLTGVLRGGTVSARKEACRLLVELRVPGGSRLVVAAAGDGDQHRDVRRAAAVVLAALLDDPAVGPVLAEVASTPELGSALLAVAPSSLPVRHRATWTALVLAVARQSGTDPEAEHARENACLTLVWWVPWDAAGSVVDHALDVLTDLTSGHRSWLFAAEVLVAEAIHRGPAPASEALRAAVDGLVHLHSSGDRDYRSDAAGERDLPARQRLQTLVRRLSEVVGRAPASHGSVADVAAALASYPLLSDVAAIAAEAAVPWAEGEDGRSRRLHRLRAWADLGAAVIPVPAPDRWYGASTPPLDVDEVAAHAAALGGAGDAGGGLVALRILALAVEQRGWTAPLRGELRRLRDHQELVVRSAAMRTYTAAE